MFQQVISMVPDGVHFTPWNSSFATVHITMWSVQWKK